MAAKRLAGLEIGSRLPLVLCALITVSPLRRVTSGSRLRSNREGLPLHPGLAALDSPHSIIAPF